MKKSILLLMSVGLMVAISPGFASGPSYQNKEGPDVGLRKESVIKIETVTLHQESAIELPTVDLTYAEIPTFQVEISPAVVIVEDEAKAAPRGAGNRTLYATRDPEKSVIPRCRSFDC